MIRRAVLAIAALVSLASISNLSAGELAPIVVTNDFAQFDEAGGARTFAIDRSSVFGTLDAASLIEGLPALALLDGYQFPISGALARSAAVPRNLFPLTFANVTVAAKRTRVVPDESKEVPVGLIDNRDKVWDVSGEVGFFYGASVGGGGRRASIERKGGYVLGAIGNDKVQITGGVSYEETNFRFGRPRP
ncbi:MAG TPA: hypothetical protein VGC85_04675 [Chthoniobacterales bacterium]